ncbi:MAG TPA: PAS domain S-box protein [Puia sp.]|jgi:PAS domain S-box-containing protein
MQIDLTNSGSENDDRIKQLRDQIAILERKSRLIVDSVPQIIWENDLEGKAIYFNKPWYDYSGLTYEESEGPGWPVLVHPEDVSAVAEWHRCFRLGELFSAQARLRRFDNVYEWHLLRNQPLKDEHDAVIGWFGTATNINELKSTSILLEQRTEHLRAILEAAKDFAIITLDNQGIITDWNSGAERMFGYTREEALGRYSNFIFTDEDKYGNIAEKEIFIARKDGHSADERWHLRKDGSKFFMSGVMTPISDGGRGGFVKVARNITDRKLAEEALLLAEQRTNIAIQSSEMGEWEWNITSDVVRRNEYSNNLIGIEPGTTGNESFYGYIYSGDVDFVKRQMQTAIDGLNIFQADFRILRADNKEIRWVSSYGRVIGRKNGRASRMIGVMYDITSRKMLEKLKDDFISVASHELKTPVTSIKGYSQILLQTFKQTNDAESIEWLTKLNSQVDRLTKLLYTLLDSTSLLEGRLKLKPETFDINELLEEQIAELQLISPIHVLIWKPGSIPLVHADKSRIRQVINNLVSNAIKYSPKGEVIISSADEQDGVVITVKDFGPGIASHHHEDIFKRYYRLDQSAGNSQSLGLGLYLSQEIIKQHKGTIGVNSILGKGSSFYFKLPYS